MFTDESQFDTSSSLLRRLSDSTNHEAWAEFLERYRPMILRWCRHARLTSDEAEEMLSRVLLKLSREMAVFKLDRDRGRFRGWLKTVVQREVHDYWRSLARRPGSGRSPQVTSSELERVIDPISLEQLSEELSGGIDADLREIHQIIETARSRVAEITWLAFWKTTIDGLSARETAGELKLTITAVTQAKYRVNKMLREAALELRPENDDRSSSSL